MQKIKLNLLATYQALKRSHQYKQWIIIGLVIFMPLLIIIAYEWIFKPQAEQLHLAQAQAMQLQAEVKMLAQSATSAANDHENIAPEHTPAGSITLHQSAIDLRSLLQQVAASAGINVLLHDSVQGNMSVAFNQLPWQEALQVILDSADLTAEQQNAVWIIRSTQEEIKKTKIDLANHQQKNDLIPVETIVLPVHYAKAEALAKLLTQSKQPWLSARGAISVDERTNVLLVRDIPDNLPTIQSMIQQLDIPVRQVSIEARILNVQESFSNALGLLWTVDGSASIGNATSSTNNLKSSRMHLPYNSSNTGAMNLAITTLSSDVLLNLELKVLESENLVEELAHPRLVTADQQTAIIRQGEEIPYQQSAEYGASTISFKPAVLELQVTPHITPDNHIIMKMVVKNDSRSAQALAEDVPVITTKEIRTQVLVNNGETIVLGGIYTQGKNQQIERLPFFANLPGIGRLFISEAQQTQRKELLVFVTPRIMPD